MPRVLVFAEGGKGYYTYRDAMKMSHQEVMMYLGTNVDLDNVIRYNQFPGENRSDLEVMVLYDREYNFYNLIWAWMKYGGKDQTLVHIVSPPYMLREYFAASLEQNIMRNNEFDALISYRSGMQHTRLLELLLQLCNAGVDEEEYFQSGEFILEDLVKTDECVDFDVLDFNIYTADVSRMIYGYWSSTCEAALQKAGVMKFNSICDSYGNPLMVRNRNVRIMEVRMKKSCFTDGGERAVLLAGFMFRELFRTLFPENYMNLYAVTEYRPKERHWECLLGDSSGVPLEEKVHSLVPFVRRDEKHEEDGFASLYIIEFSSLEMGMISSLYSERMRLFQMTAAYLDWYLREDSGVSWLKLGGAETPECFAPKELLDFCRRVLPSYEETTDEETKGDQTEVDVNPDHVCSFCGKPALFIYKMSDGRSMCRSYKQQQVSMREEIKDLYLNTVDFMTKGYHISFKKNIHLRLKSAEAIRKRCRMSGGGRVLGFYNDKNRELWIESRGPRNAVQDTMIHELTHAWQFAELDVKRIQRKKPEEYLLYLEGHACYMEVDIMRKLGEEEYAGFLDRQFEQRNDEYGQGYRMIKKIIAEKAAEGSHNTPFAIMTDTVNNL